MRSANIGQLLFESAVKVKPARIKHADINKLMTDPTYTIGKEQVLTLNSQFFGLQFNPVHKSPAKVAHPSQLTYFANTNDKDADTAKTMYNAIRLFITKKTDEAKAKFLNKNPNVVSKNVLELLNGEGAEFEYELVKSLQDANHKDIKAPQNIPSVVNKFYTQFASHLNANIVKIKYNGGKFVLVADVGVVNPATKQRLAIKKDDSGKSYYAEALMNRDFALKTLGKDRVAAIEDAIKNGTPIPDYFIGPDFLSFRLPSSELHSAMPLKIVGFTQNNSQNSIIVPDKIVPLHGSDYDVDALYVIARATNKKGAPIGYDLVDGQWKFLHIPVDNNVTFEDFLVSFDKEFPEEDIEKYLQNMILESFLEIVTAEHNRDRMLKPIDMSFIHEFVNELKSSGINTDPLDRDLSHPLYAQKAHSSSFGGLIGTGIFANGIKALAFLIRSGKGGKPSKIKMLESLQTRAEGNVNPKRVLTDNSDPSDYDLMYADENGKEHTIAGIVNNAEAWGILDGFLNASIDNVKEQLLPYFNITKDTARYFIGMVSNGVNWKTALLFMKQPAIKYMADAQFRNRDRVVNALKYLLGVENLLEASTGNEVISHADLTKSLRNYNDLQYFVDKKLSGEELSDAEMEYILFQAQVAQAFYKYGRLGDAVSSLSSYLKILAEQETTEQDFLTIEAKRNTVFGDTFPYDITDIHKSNPHLASYDNAFLFFQEARKSFVLKYADAIYKNIDVFYDKMNSMFRFSKDKFENTKMQLDAIMKLIMMSTVDADVYSNSTFYSPLHKKTYTGLDAFLKKTEAVVDALTHSDIFPKGSWEAEFVSKLDVNFSRGKKRNEITFYSDTADSYAIQKTMSFGFDALSGYEFEIDPNSQYGVSIVKSDSNNASTSNIQELLIQLGVLEHGLVFLSKNYSRYIDGKYLVDMYAKYESNLRNIATKGLTAVGGYFKVLIAITEMNSNVHQTYHFDRVVKNVRTKDGKTFETKAGTAVIDNTLTYYDVKLSREKDAGEEGTVSNPQIFVDNLISEKNEYGFTGERKTVYVKTLSDAKHDYYKIIYSTTATHPIANIQSAGLTGMYNARMAVRPDMLNASVKELTEYVAVSENALIRYGNTPKIGDYVSITRYDDYGMVKPVVYTIEAEGVSKGGDDTGNYYSLKRMRDDFGKSESRSLLETVLKHDDFSKQVTELYNETKDIDKAKALVSNFLLKYFNDNVITDIQTIGEEFVDKIVKRADKAEARVIEKEAERAAAEAVANNEKNNPTVTEEDAQAELNSCIVK